MQSPRRTNDIWRSLPFDQQPTCQGDRVKAIDVLPGVFRTAANKSAQIGAPAIPDFDRARANRARPVEPHEAEPASRFAFLVSTQPELRIELP